MSGLFDPKGPPSAGGEGQLAERMARLEANMRTLRDREGGWTPLLSAAVATEESTNSGGAVDLATYGPEVALDVPADGLLAVYARVSMTTAPAGGAVVYLREAGGSPAVIFQSPTVGYVTLHTLPFGDTGSRGTAEPAASGLIVFPVTAGSRKYRLQYSSVGGVVSSFKNRKLWVGLLAID